MTVTNSSDEEIRDRIVALTRDLMLVPTTVSRPAEIVRGLQLIKNHLEGLANVKVLSYEDKGVPSLLALPEGIERPDILLCAHIDVVDYPDLAVFTSRVEDGRIYGPGAGDMKGALAVALEIFHSFQMAHPGLSLGIVITTDEEVGGASGIGFLVKEKNLRCGIALVPDGGSLTRITTHEKGILHLKVEALGKYSHASRPWEGKNALHHLLKNFKRLEALFDALKAEDHYWYPTCSLTVIRTTNEVINRIPDHAEGFLDIRFPQPHTTEEFLSKVRAVMDSDIHVEVLIKAEPTDLRPDPLYFEVTKEITQEKVQETRDHGGSDARFISASGTPVIISRPLVGNLHSEDEWIDIDSMVSFYKIYETYITRKLLK